MFKSKIILVVAILGALAVTGFQCASTELTSAKLYIQQKNYDKALDALQKEVQKNPASDEGYYLLGVVLGEKEQYAEMVDAYNKSVAISDKFKQSIEDSKRYFWANLFNKAVGLYQKGANSKSEDSTKVYYDRSISLFEQAVKIEPDSADTYRNLAFVYLSKGDNEKAIQPLQELINKNKSEEGYRYLGEILYNKGTQLKDKDSLQAMQFFNNAVTILEEGRKVYPNNTDILLLLSNAYIGANKIEVAMDAFKAGVEKEPDNKYYRYNYGVLLLGADDFTGAEEQFKRAVELDPAYENAIYNLAVTYVRWGTAINKAAEEKGEATSNYKDKYKLALPHLEKIVELKPTDAQIWELLGRVYTILGMQDKANNAFAEADKLRK